MSRDRGRTGFTLIEVAVAMLVSASVILGARAVMTTIADHSAALSSVRDETSTQANGLRVLRQLLLHVEAGSDPNSSFVGTMTETVFDTWCLTAQGWYEHCKASLRLQAITEQAGVVSVVASLSTGEILELLRTGGPARLAYLENPVHGGGWSSSWGPGSVAPRALGVLLPIDTLIFRTGVSP